MHENSENEPGDLWNIYPIMCSRMLQEDAVWPNFSRSCYKYLTPYRSDNTSKTNTVWRLAQNSGIRAYPTGYVTQGERNLVGLVFLNLFLFTTAEINADHKFSFPHFVLNFLACGEKLTPEIALENQFNGLTYRITVLICTMIEILCSWNSPVSIVIGLQAGWRRNRSSISGKVRNFLFSVGSEWVQVRSGPVSNGYHGHLPPG